VTLLKIFTDLTAEEIGDLEQQVATEPFRRTAQRTLATLMTRLVHGDDATDAVIAASEALFGRGDLHALDAGTLADAVAELPGGVVTAGDTLTDALVAAGLAESRNAARRIVGEGAVSLNGERMVDAERVLTASDFLCGVAAILRRGKRNLAVARPAA
jgi:tyrosyl-tRNA synthetase